MGAYYTKEDITEYIAKSTIVPRLFDMAKPKCKVAFEREGDGPDTTVWRHLQADPDRYIYEPVRRGVVREDGTMLPESDLPPHVQKGMHDPKARMFDKNYNLKEAHLEDAEGKPLTLPTETWREYVARRERCLSLRDKLGNGELREINDLITHNLDLRQFAQDVIENSEGPELLRAFWQAIESVTVLDPTVGSGAFLFAALNILEPLYEACLDRMEAFLAELERSGAKHRPEKYADFKKVLEAIARHPNRKYFIYKSIIINNLYGVDIMDEAVEICKLRLFLKLVAQVDAAERIEPLPDIDFNIRAGNTLVGFVSLDEVRQAVNKEKSGQGKMVFSNVLGVIEEKAREVDRLFKAFRAQQTELGGEVTPEDKKSLQARLSELEGELNRYLAGEYGISVGAHGRAPSKRMPETRVAEPNGRIAMRPYEGWLASHKPFHWFIEFYGILQKGGFDVVIGNPPYVEYSKVFNDYTLRNYETLECGNLYACVIERNSHIQKHCGQTGMIIPHSAICTDRMANLQDILLGQDNKIWLSTFCIRPSKLFDGVDQRLSIFIVACGRNERTVYSSCYHRWHGNYRPFLFSSISFADVTDFEYSNSVPKVERLLEIDILHKISKMKKMAENISVRTGAKVYFHNAPRYWIRAMDFAPYFWNERDGQQLSTQVKIILVPIKEASLTMVTILNSSLFYWWFIVFSDCRHLNMREIERLPIDLQSVGQQKRQDLNALRNKLMEDYKRNKNRKTCEYKATGKVKYDEYYPKHSKPIIDEIDKIFATHYGLNAIELDFVINYDIKYRMGQGAGAEEE